MAVMILSVKNIRSEKNIRHNNKVPKVPSHAVPQVASLAWAIRSSVTLAAEQAGNHKTLASRPRDLTNQGATRARGFNPW